MYIDLVDLKQHLDIIDDADDAVLTNLLAAAEGMVTNYLTTAGVNPYDQSQAPTGVTVPPVPDPIKQAVRMIAAHFYENREATVQGANSIELEFGVGWLLLPYRSIAF